VIHINAESARTIAHSYCRSAEELFLGTTSLDGTLSTQLVEHSTSEDEARGPLTQAATIDYVRHTLTTTEKRWVMLFENFKGQGSDFRIKDYLPLNVRGTVLICASFGEEQFDPAAYAWALDAIQVRPLTTAHAIDLARDMLGISDSTQGGLTAFNACITGLVDTLDRHTLAISLAVNCLLDLCNNHLTGRAIDKFTQNLRRSDHDRPRHLSKTPKAVWRSWSMTLQRMKERNEHEAYRDALELLSVRLHLSNDFLPSRCLGTVFERGHSQSRCHDDDNGPGQWDSHSSDDIPRLVRAESLLISLGVLSKVTTLGEQGTVMDLTLYDCARASFGVQKGKAFTSRTLWLKAITALDGVISTRSSENLACLYALAPSHVDACLDTCDDPVAQLMEGHPNRTDSTRILLSFARVYMIDKRYEDARVLQHQCVALTEAYLGSCSAPALAAMAELATTLTHLDRRKQALEIRQQVYDERRKILDGRETQSGDANADRTPGPTDADATNYYAAASLLAESCSDSVPNRRSALRLRKEVLDFAHLLSNQRDSSNRQRRSRMEYLLKAQRDYARSLFDMHERQASLRLRQCVYEVITNLGPPLYRKYAYATNAKEELLVSLIDAKHLLTAAELADDIMSEREVELGSDNPMILSSQAMKATLDISRGKPEAAVDTLRPVAHKLGST